jgi:hypothetical protein
MVLCGETFVNDDGTVVLWCGVAVHLRNSREMCEWLLYSLMVEVESVERCPSVWWSVVTIERFRFHEQFSGFVSESIVKILRSKKAITLGNDLKFKNI